MVNLTRTLGFSGIVVSGLDSVVSEIEDDLESGGHRKRDWLREMPDNSIEGTDACRKDKEVVAMRTTLQQVIDQLKALLEEGENSVTDSGLASLHTESAGLTGLRGGGWAAKESCRSERVGVTVMSGHWKGVYIECRFANGILELTLSDKDLERRAVLHRQSPALARKLGCRLGVTTTVSVRNDS
ncbi:hypothetical protein [Burkholderia sp. Bp8986]|uniref:hypothetical protein n=1 Tax=Burkholderia sp. Bp8986 TaxID=2184550 RepID=UPI000F5B4CBC|nr:hypothetical protein [Burkholderia sp. Bp8986]